MVAADAAHVDRTTADFRAWYRASMPHVRASVDATLDSLARGGVGRLRGARRAELLRTPPSAHAVALARLPMTADDARCAAGTA